MSAKVKLTFAAVLALVASAALVGEAAAATHQRRGWHSAHGIFIHRSVALPYRSAWNGRYSGPFRTDSAPLTGGGY
jgi:hypothetical protein